MSDDKKKAHKYDGETFENIVKSSMHKGSMTHFATKLIEDFTEEQKADTLGKVKGFSSVLDRLKYLLEALEEENDGSVE